LLEVVSADIGDIEEAANRKTTAQARMIDRAGDAIPVFDHISV